MYNKLHQMFISQQLPIPMEHLMDHQIPHLTNQLSLPIQEEMLMQQIH